MQQRPFTNKKRIGYNGEKTVCNYLCVQGYTIICTNYTKRGGEIDIIARKEDYLCFVEVKVINGTEDISFTITPKKITTIQRTIKHYCHTHPFTLSLQCQIDIAYVRNNTVHEYVSNAVWH